MSFNQTETTHNILKALHKVYGRAVRPNDPAFPPCEKDPEKAAVLLTSALTADSPSMIARFGAFELNAIVNYLGVSNKKPGILRYIKGEIQPWWWDQKLLRFLQTNAGFFPATEENVSRFARLMLEDTKQVDILGSWLAEEILIPSLSPNLSKVHIINLDPFWSTIPWTKALDGKKVLVVHPFNEQIEEQYEKRNLLFDREILPDFELQTIKAVQTSGGEQSAFADWFEALDYMKSQIDATDYDVCLIGAGAYGFPLAAHVKRSGKKAFHIGGSLQLLFGIKGNRWENPNYGVKEWGIPYGSYTNIMNEHWVKPSDVYRPSKAVQVEGACYW